MQYHQEEISIVIIQPTPLECRDLDLPRPQHPCSRPWGRSLLAFCWRRVIRRRVQSHTFACSARPQPPRRQPCARVRLARLWAVLDVVSVFSHDVPYTYSLSAPQYISLGCSAFVGACPEAESRHIQPGRPIFSTLQQCRLSLKW